MGRIANYVEPHIEWVSEVNKEAKYLVRVTTDGQYESDIASDVYNRLNIKCKLAAYARVEDLYFKTKKEAYDFFKSWRDYALTMDGGCCGEDDGSLWAYYMDHEGVNVTLVKWENFYSDDKPINLEEDD